MKTKQTDEPGHWNDLARCFHEPARLSIVSTLAEAAGPLRFQEVKEQCALTDGNLNRHLKVLHEAGAVQVNKSGRGRGSRTEIILSDQGRAEFMSYLGVLEKALERAKGAVGAESGTDWATGSLLATP